VSEGNGYRGSPLTAPGFVILAVAVAIILPMVALFIHALIFPR